VPHKSSMLVLVLAMLGVALAASQSELVIVKDGTKEYHRPSCAVVRDGRDVLAMTRAQAESRGFKPHAACDPSNPAAATTVAPRGKPPAPVFVYVSPGDNKYHKDTCRKLAADRRKVTVEEAATTKHWPCPVCRPPIRKKGEPIVPPRSPRG
jgi:hypothetical protein